jgi:hypothetical protein
MSGLLEGPVFTRPREWRGHEVPEVLLSGNHAAIARWRRDMALRRTAANRPDLIEALRARDRQVHDKQTPDSQTLDRPALDSQALDRPALNKRDGQVLAEAASEASGAAGSGQMAAGFPVSGEDMAH